MIPRKYLPSFFRRSFGIFFVVFLSTLLTGCMRDMQDQLRYEPLEKSEMFENRMSSRPVVEGTVARGQLKLDEVFYQGKKNGVYVSKVPVEITEEFILRGQERYQIFCSVCHDGLGYGNGMVVQRGYPAPETFHSKRLREISDGYLYDVISNGFGVMMGFRKEITEKDRWAIVSYIRALQYSQNVDYADLSHEEKQHVNEIKKYEDIKDSSKHH